MLKLLKNNEVLKFILLLSIASAIGLQGWRTIFNNFAVSEVGINGTWIGIIQSVREIPGLLTFLVIFATIILTEYQIVSFSSIILGIGVALTGFFPSHFGLLFTTIIMSVGFHYFETTRQSLILQNFDKKDTPLILGYFKSITAISNIIVGIVIFILTSFLSMKLMFLIIGVTVIILASYSYRIKFNRTSPHTQHKKMVFRKKYWLFYVLNFLAGARRQIFVVFAVFLLVKHYNYSIQFITILFVFNNVINIYAGPFVAHKINRFGEKKILATGYILIFLVFLSYAFLENPWIAGGLYIIDNILFNINIGIKTYFHKTADQEDIAPSIAVGFTINHITAVFFPFIAGLLWMIDIKFPFLLGAGIALFSIFFACMMKSHSSFAETEI